MSELDLKALWTSDEPAEEFTVDIDALEARAADFERTVRRRNIMEWGAAALVVLWVGYDALGTTQPLQLLGQIIIIFAAVGISIYLYLRGRVTMEIDPSCDTRSYIEEVATSLEAQARLLARAPIWYLAPFAIGLVVQFVGYIPPDGAPTRIWWLVVSMVVATFLAIAWFNLRGARTLRQEALALRSQLD